MVTITDEERDALLEADDLGAERCKIERNKYDFKEFYELLETLCTKYDLDISKLLWEGDNELWEREEL